MISLKTINEVNKNDFSVGIKSDYSFQLLKKEEYIGHAHINILLDGTVYIEWVELLSGFRGKGYFRDVLICLMNHFKTDKLSFESSEENKEIYKHLGAVITGYDNFREMTSMELYRKSLMSEIQKAIDERETTHYGIYSDIGRVLEKFSTEELAKFYIKENESDLRYYLEQQITAREISKEKYKK